MYIHKKLIIFIVPFVFFVVSGTLAQNRVAKSDTAVTRQQLILNTNQLPANATPSKVNVEPADIPATERKTQVDNYKSYRTALSSNVFGAEFFDTASLSFEPNLRP
ncbi:MAG: hypothetical protein ABI367_09855 [Mucilaginibacter sp.]